MKEAIALGEESEEEIDTNSVIEAFEKEVEEITSQVNQSIEAAKDHLKARIAKEKPSHLCLQTEFPMETTAHERPQRQHLRSQYKGVCRQRSGNVGKGEDVEATE